MPPPLTLTVRVQGTQALLNKLADIGRAAPGITRRARREAAQLVLADAYNRAPFRTGKLRRSGRIVDVDESTTAVTFDEDYALPVHEGHHTKSGSFVQGHPFLRDALEANRKRSEDRYATVVRRELAARAK